MHAQVQTRPREEPHDWLRVEWLANSLNGDPLLDWLDLYGREAGFLPDTCLPGYSRAFDAALYARERAEAFLTAVRQALGTRLPVTEVPGVRTLAPCPSSAERTASLMVRGAPCIAQATVWSLVHQAAGVADFLVRADFINEIAPGTVDLPSSRHPAPRLGCAWHYRILAVSSRPLVGVCGDQASARRTVELGTLNSLLAEVQGHDPGEALLLGQGDPEDPSSLTLATADRHLAEGQLARALSGFNWLRRVREEGARWQVTPQPSVPELRPNLLNEEDWPWRNAKEMIAREQGAGGRVWGIGLDARQPAPSAFKDEPVKVRRFGSAAPCLPRVFLDTLWSEGRRPQRPLLFACGWFSEENWNFKPFVLQSWSEAAVEELRGSLARFAQDRLAESDGLAPLLVTWGASGQPKPCEFWPADATWLDLLNEVVLRQGLDVPAERAELRLASESLPEALRPTWPDHPSDARSAVAGLSRALDEATRRKVAPDEVKVGPAGEQPMRLVLQYVEANCKAMATLMDSLRPG